jgi:tetratricopeptide (TPR) repeat protein
MNLIKNTVMCSLLLLLGAPPYHAQGTDLDQNLDKQKGGEQDQQGNHEQAVLAAQKAIEVAIATVGPDHPYVAISLNNLALLYSKQGDYLKAEPLYKRSLAIWEKLLGPDHPYVANLLNILSELYHAMGKEKEALEADQRIERIREAR